MPRAAGDTWDIVTSVGFTALAVCAARALDAALDPPLAI
ncbi:MAG TPA: SAM-dependent methyltransferase, partial [Mycobacterium sp.]